MIDLGNTFDDVSDFILINLDLKDADKETLLKVVKLTVTSRELEYDDNIEEVFGGKYYLVEDKEDDFNFLLLNAIPDIRLPVSESNCGMDFGDYFNDSHSLASIGTCINNSGGNTFIISRDLFKKYPTIHEHLAYHSQWLDPERDQEKLHKEYIDQINAVIL